MADTFTPEHIHTLAFRHYLRTGQRLTNAEWLTSYECKFNPYHDQIGRFTSPPGVVVSWGKNGSGRSKPDRMARNGAARAQRSSTRPLKPKRGSESTIASPHPERTAGVRSFRSDLVRNSTVEAGHAETYFELNKRQTGLNSLREAAGANPSATVKADMDEIQKRLDADRARLDARQASIDAETTELLRAGLPAFDIGAGAFQIGAGRGKVRDYLSVLGALPLGAIIHQAGGIIQIGGAQSVVKRLIKAEGIRGVEVHHVPSKKSLELAGISIPPSKTSVVAQLIEDHRATRSWGSSTKSQRFRTEVAKLLARGDVKGALRMEFDDLARIKGGAYSHSAEEVARYIHDQLNKFTR